MSAMLAIFILLLCSLHIYATKDNIICPDGKSMCFDEETCCIMASGEYGCCPLPSAVCCKDRIHCCPYGYSCNLQTVTCDKAGLKIPMLINKAGRPVEGPLVEKSEKVNSVTCPDGGSYCPDDNTCCKMSIGGYSCCPLAKATCCSDNIHCCPSGYTCDIAEGTCTRGNQFVMMRKKTPPKELTSTKNRLYPHGKYYCPDGETCCPSTNGDYSYCPIENAVCCPDKEHCCPPGFKCDDGESRCIRNGLSIPYITQTKKKAKNSMKSFPALLVSGRNSLKNVFCPDRISHCPDGFTCCKGLLGLWECCPLPDATCCADHKHCCPHKTICNVKTGTCTPKITKEISVPWKTKVKSEKNQEKLVQCPDRVSYCPQNYTCCLLSSGMYGCCPYPTAVCCPDHTHCCPHGTTCDVKQGTCIRQTDSTGISAIWSKVGKTMVKCHDGSSCAGKETCCELSSGGYGCCPYEEAVCCSDGLHCCPHGTTCDVKQGTCIRQTDSSGISAIWSKVGKTMVKCQMDHHVQGRRHAVKCHDGSSCAGKETCCELSSGGYGCCPYEEAVCCSDGLHCCPHGTTCDVKQGTCIRQTDSSGISAIWSKVGKTMVKCLDGSSCAGKETCCKLASGGYGCCPYEEAVCCSDGLHCCPHGTTCDVKQGTCIRQTDSSGISAIWSKVGKTMVKCHDGSSCAGKETCCELSSGGYGCCPYEEAVCCSDGLHCCPHGTTCDVKQGTCIRQTDSTGISAIWSKVGKTMVKCHDGSSCAGKETCCELSSGGYGCCPYEEAVCCSDGLHCCPHGTTCDVKQGTCIRQTDSSGISAIWSKVGKTMVKCLDGSSCAGKETCCKLASGGYGCCPYEEAVCCSDGLHCCPHGTTCDDGLHCCPHGTTCDVKQGTCIRQTDSSGISAIWSKVGKTMVKCHDGSSCAGKETCCELSSGGYGCCPYEEAVCCSDGLHCCPHGTTCDVKQGTCIRQTDSTGISAIWSKVGKTMVKCHDGSSCAGKETCCELSSGGYGCCPYEEAVCCSDGLHCCPHGTTCDVKQGTCIRQTDSSGISAIWSKVGKTMVKCLDGSSCAGKETCCKLASGGYGCCPYEEAVCCSDGLHCCPHGTTCDVKQGTCIRQTDSSGISAIWSKVGKTMVKCHDGSSCAGKETCCELSSGGYGCCPYEEAVCCSDGLHCCPHGTTCDVEYQPFGLRWERQW